MAIEKVKYICVSPNFLGENRELQQRLHEELSQLMARLARSLEESLGWLRLERIEQGKRV